MAKIQKYFVLSLNAKKTKYYEGKGKNLLITGGASGIGKIMGRLALQKGAKSVAVWDINEANIETVVAENSKYGVVKGYKVDVASSEEVFNTYNVVKEELGSVDIVIQCAGIVTSNRFFYENSLQEIDRTMTINAIAPMYVGLVALQDMVARDNGQIATVASAAGMLSMPKMSVYTASKWSAIGWSDSVRIELQQMKSKVQITTIAPYFIDTGMFDGIKSKVFPILDPEKTAKKILKGIEKGRSFVGIPFAYHFIRLMEGLFPQRLFDWFFGDVFGLYTVMNHFKGRK